LKDFKCLTIDDLGLILEEQFRVRGGLVLPRLERSLDSIDVAVFVELAESVPSIIS
jgi:hypothetical protein